MIVGNLQFEPYRGLIKITAKLGEVVGVAEPATLLTIGEAERLATYLSTLAHALAINREAASSGSEGLEDLL